MSTDPDRFNSINDNQPQGISDEFVVRNKRGSASGSWVVGFLSLVVLSGLTFIVLGKPGSAAAADAVISQVSQGLGEVTGEPAMTPGVQPSSAGN